MGWDRYNTEFWLSEAYGSLTYVDELGRKSQRSLFAKKIESIAPSEGVRRGKAGGGTGNDGRCRRRGVESTYLKPMSKADSGK